MSFHLNYLDLPDKLLESVIIKSSDIFNNFKLSDEEKIRKYISDNFFEHNHDSLLKYESWYHYVHYYDEMINYALRNNSIFTKKMLLVFYDMISIIEKSIPLNTELFLFRGVHTTDDFNPNDWNIDDIVTDFGF